MKNSSFRFDFRRNLSLSPKLPRSFVKSIAEQHGGDVIVEYNNLCQLFQSKAHRSKSGFQGKYSQ